MEIFDFIIHIQPNIELKKKRIVNGFYVKVSNSIMKNN